MNALTPRADRIDDLFPEMIRRFFKPAPWVEESGAEPIRVDVTENETAYQVSAAVPGAKREDIHVSVDGNLVTIMTETREQKEQKEGERVLLRESRYGRASRSFTVAQDVDAERVVAKLQDGVLQLTLPKRPDSARRKIAIQ